ncbi:MAG: hypothetical protein ABSB84_15840 [Verrucomicrobiota bacterium]
MKTNPRKEGPLTGNAAGFGVVTREMGQTPHSGRAVAQPILAV